MDPALLRERELFKKRAIATPVVEKRIKKEPQSHDGPGKSKSKPSSQSKSSQKAPTDTFSYKTMQGSSQYKFGVLAKVVKHMKQRHLDGDCHPLTFEEILDETNQLDLGSNMKRWLVTEALTSNPKIHVSPEGRYSFKPPFNIKDKRGLLRLLQNYDQRGLGGIYLEDVHESLPNADKCIKILGNQILTLIRPIDKRKVLFYNDASCEFEIEDEFKKLWRSIPVDGLDENKVDEYLEKQGIVSMQDNGPKKLNPAPKRKRNQKKNRNFKRHNDHMGDIFEDYTDK
uniref:Transcription initiation factor IIE subunit beta n=1 Tax=Strigamia maritima TaxID=126957 RepID=T1JLJ2_STRMM